MRSIDESRPGVFSGQRFLLVGRRPTRQQRTSAPRRRHTGSSQPNVNYSSFSSRFVAMFLILHAVTADKTCEDLTGWFGGDNGERDCSWFTEHAENCVNSGSVEGTDGLTALEACCSCAGCSLMTMESFRRETRIRQRMLSHEGNGWNDGEAYSIKSIDGSVVASGLLSEGSMATEVVCLQLNTCYSMSVSSGTSQQYEAIWSFRNMRGKAPHAAETFCVVQAPPAPCDGDVGGHRGVLEWVGGETGVDCEWFAQYDGRCAAAGSIIGSDGLAAFEACCACDGCAEIEMTDSGSRGAGDGWDGGQEYFVKNESGVVVEAGRLREGRMGRDIICLPTFECFSISVSSGTCCDSEVAWSFRDLEGGAPHRDESFCVLSSWHSPAPTLPTSSPTLPTSSPTSSPTLPTSSPTQAPSVLAGRHTSLSSVASAAGEISQGSRARVEVEGDVLLWTSTLEIESGQHVDLVGILTPSGFRPELDAKNICRHIHVKTRGVFSAENLAFVRGRAEDGSGGSLMNEGLVVSLLLCSFSSCSASEDGGALSNSGTIQRMDNCSFLDNAAAVNGGGLSNYGNIEGIRSCTFVTNSADNAAEGSGGGLFNSGNIEGMRSCTFVENSANYMGGAISNFRGRIGQIHFSHFTTNTATYGGGIHSRDGVIKGVNWCTFVGNSATGNLDSKGGALVLYGSAARIDHILSCHFNDNIATYIVCFG